MTEHPKPCRWVGHSEPRMLRSHVRDCEAASCEGCQPCGEPHCGVCGIRHVEALTCPGCVGVVRDDLALIETLAEKMLPEATHRGVDSEAAMLAGPSADVEAWRNRWMSARNGRIPSDWLEDCRDELHPLYVLGTWDMLITAHYDHGTRTQRVTIESAVQYLGANLTDLAQDPGFAFEELAREVRSCRGHMEDVLQEGEREENGAPCPMCGAGDLIKVTDERQTTRCGCGPRPRMKHGEHGPCTCPFSLRIEQLNPDKDPVSVRVYDEPPLPLGHAHPRTDQSCIACHREAEWDARHAAHAKASDEDDRWRCPKRNCGASYTEHDYRVKVEAVYVLHADRLTASQISETYRVPEGTVRQWALRDKVRKYGADAQGRTLYDVADVVNARDAIPA